MKCTGTAKPTSLPDGRRVTIGVLIYEECISITNKAGLESQQSVIIKPKNGMGRKPVNFS